MKALESDVCVEIDGRTREEGEIVV